MSTKLTEVAVTWAKRLFVPGAKGEGVGAGTAFSSTSACLHSPLLTALKPPRSRFVRFGGRAALDAPSRPSVSARDRVFRRSLALADALAASLALLFGVVVLGDDALRPAVAVFVPLVVLLSKLLRLYDRDDLLLRRSTLDDAPAVGQLSSLYVLLVWLLAPVVIAGTLGRGQVVGLWGLLFLGALCGRTAARALARGLAPAERCLIVSDAPTHERIARKLRDARGVKAQIADVVVLEPQQDLYGTLVVLEDMIARSDIHRVLLAPRTADGDGVLDAIRLVKGLGVKVSLLPRIFEVVESSVEFDDLDGVTLMGVRSFGLTRSSWLLKRTMDTIGAIAMLLALAPLMAVIALAIRLESPGGVLFSQTRVGRGGRRFRMFKFRTMVDGADAMKAGLRGRNEADGLFKIADDPRITRVGRLLRRTSLDELPQLLNVLRGDMSLVGPRPLVVDEDEQVQGWDRRRLHLTPGMTGQWQILGSARIPLHEMVKIDYLYVANWSLWGDVKILLRTVPYLLSRRGM
jgi:exopolysaccharide biosynthesis polyprenyl glycosylphosphotransferase